MTYYLGCMDALAALEERVRVLRSTENKLHKEEQQIIQEIARIEKQERERKREERERNNERSEKKDRDERKEGDEKEFIAALNRIKAYFPKQPQYLTVSPAKTHA